MMLRSAAVVAGLALGLMLDVAKADVIDTFGASGAFANASILGGSISIDITNGDVVSSRLTDSAVSSEFNSIIVSTPGYGGYLLRISSSNAVDNVPRLELVLGTNTLVNYDGGVIYSVTMPSPAFYVSDIVTSTNGFALDSGALTLVSQVSSVPLPSSAPMFGAALLGLAGLGYAAKRKKAAAAA